MLLLFHLLFLMLLPRMCAPLAPDPTTGLSNFRVPLSHTSILLLFLSDCFCPLSSLYYFLSSFPPPPLPAGWCMGQIGVPMVDTRDHLGRGKFFQRSIFKTFEGSPAAKREYYNRTPVTIVTVVVQVPSCLHSPVYKVLEV